VRPILVFGAGGRVGGALASLVAHSDWNGRVAFDGLAQAGATNITDSDAVALAIDTQRPAAIINFAACTLPYAEKPEAHDEAWAVNDLALRSMREITDIPIVHISTDCVFHGEMAGQWRENHEPLPRNHYGLTKWEGEKRLKLKRKNSNDVLPHIIIRTTGVYLADKPNFLKLVLDKARAGEGLEVVSDTLYSPTDARELARAILTATERVIEDPSVSGTYHFAGPDVMSYVEFADLVLDEAGLSAPIKGVSAAEREAIEGFKRPKNASLNSDKFAETFGLRHRPTRDCVRDLVQPRPS